MEPIFPTPGDLPGLDLPDFGGAGAGAADDQLDPAVEPVDHVVEPDPIVDDIGVDDIGVDGIALDDPAVVGIDLDDPDLDLIDLVDPIGAEPDDVPDAATVLDGEDDAVEDRLEELLGAEYDIDGEALTAAMSSGDAQVVATLLADSGIPTEALELSAAAIADFVANGGVVVLPIEPLPTPTVLPDASDATDADAAPVGPAAPAAPGPVEPSPADAGPADAGPAIEPAAPAAVVAPSAPAAEPGHPSLPGAPLDVDRPTVPNEDTTPNAPASPTAPNAPTAPTTPAAPSTPTTPELPGGPVGTMPTPESTGLEPATVPAVPGDLPPTDAADAGTSMATVVEVDEAAGIVVLEVSGERIEVPVADLQAAIDAAGQHGISVPGAGGIDPSTGDIALAGIGTILVAAAGLRLARARGSVRLVGTDMPLPPPDPRTRRA